MNNRIIINNIVNSISKVTKNFSKELHEPSLPKKEFKFIGKTLNDKKFMIGPFVKKFEDKLIRLTKSKHVITTNTGSSALHISLKLLDIGNNDEILIPTLHYISSVNSTIYCGATPHFVDIEKNSLGVDCLKLNNYLKKISVIKKINVLTKNQAKQLKL